MSVAAKISVSWKADCDTYNESLHLYVVKHLHSLESTYKTAMNIFSISITVNGFNKTGIVIPGFPNRLQDKTLLPTNPLKHELNIIHDKELTGVGISFHPGDLKLFEASDTPKSYIALQIVSRRDQSAAGLWYHINDNTKLPIIFGQVKRRSDQIKDARMLQSIHILQQI
jgi:hypothetical protein